MPFLQSNKLFRELVYSYQIESCYHDINDAFKDLGIEELSSLRKFYDDETVFVHQDEIDNFTSKLFPIDYEREQE